MPGRHSRLVFAIAFIASLAVHVWLLAFVPLPQRGAAAGVRESVVSVYLEPPEPPKPEPEPDPIEPPPPQEMPLGLNAPLPPLPTWLGFKDFMPQLAPQADTEQGAFTDEPVAAAPREAQATSNSPPPMLDAPPAPEASEAAKPQATQENAATDITPVPPDAADQKTESPTHDAPLAEEATKAAEPEHLPVQEKGHDPIFAATLIDLIEQLQRDVQQPSANAPAKASDAAKPSNAENKPDPSAPKSPPPQQQNDASNKPVAPQPVSGVSNQGTESDKQSPPTSVIEVPRDHWQMGKPLAGKGLELKPRRPTFTLLTMLTAAPGNPLCEMSFDRDGNVKRARIVETSGDSRIDEAILNSLYYWRASGDELAKLLPGRTLEIQIRIVLSRRKGG